MTISNFVAYVKQAWKNKPDTSTPLSAPRLIHIEDGIKMTSDAIEKIAAAVVSQIVNDPDKIASMAALYAVDQKIGNVANLPNGAADVVTAITQQNSNISGDGLVNNPNDVTSMFTIFNGWDSNAVNYPSAFKNKQPILITIWTWRNTIGTLNADRVQIMACDGYQYCRSYNNNQWSDWIG